MSSHPVRLKSFAYTGRHHYFLTFCTDRRRPVFQDPAHVAILSTQLPRCADAESMAVDVYCVMPDHVHLLIKGQREDADMRRFMHALKQHTGWEYRKLRNKPLWQGSYYDHVLRPEEGTASVMSYIVNNPVRAGLVTAPADYPFWDSLTQTREGLLKFIEGAGEWRPDPVVLGAIGGRPSGQPIKG